MQFCILFLESVTVMPSRIIYIHCVNHYPWTHAAKLAGTEGDLHQIHVINSPVGSGLKHLTKWHLYTRNDELRKATNDNLQINFRVLAEREITASCPEAQAPVLSTSPLEVYEQKHHEHKRGISVVEWPLSTSIWSLNRNDKT